MNEQEISALIDELLSEKRGKTQPLPDEAELSEELSAPAEIVSHAMPEPDAEPEEPAAPEDTEPAYEPENADEPDVPELPQPAHIPDAEERRGRLYAALNAQPAPEHDAVPRQKYRTRDILAGLVLVLLSIYGIYALVLRGMEYVRTLNQDNAAKDAAAACILPLVITDTPEFSDPGELTDEQFLTVSVWAAVTQDKLTGYPQNFDMYSVPAADLTALGNQLFGVNRSPKHHTIGFSGELRFYYDAETDSYLLPANPELFTYEPVIREMQQNDAGEYTVTADFVAEQPAWKQAEPVTVKTMQYTLTEQNGVFRVRSAGLLQ